MIEEFISRFVRRLGLIVLLACMAASSSGCIWLAIPGLAYSGYQLTEKKDSATDSSQDSSKTQAKAASSSGASTSGAPNEDNFE